MLLDATTLKLKTLYLLCVISSLCISKLYGQNEKLTDSLLTEKLYAYSKSRAENILFLHVDKTLYTNNEDIRFSSYLLKSSNDINQHTVLSTILINSDNRQITFEKKFNLENGLSAGSIHLSDSIAPGNYQLMAYTNVLNKNNQPIAIFTQPLTIKSITEWDFNASLILLNNKQDDNSIQAKVNVVIKNKSVKTRPVITYTINNKAVKNVSLDKLNTGLISILDQEIANNDSQSVLKVAITYNGKTQYLQTNLPRNKKSFVNLKFYPEGGDLINNIPGVVGIEATDAEGKPLIAKCILYKDNQAVDTILTNYYGIGKFNLQPDMNSKYNLKLLADTFLKNDTAISLPNIKPSGLVIKIDQAVVKDTLRLDLLGEVNNQVARVLVHNYRDAFAYFDISMKSKSRRVVLALNALPKGIAMVTVLNDMGKPIAERLFFAHYDNKNNTVINTNKEEYKKGEKVLVQLKLNDASGTPSKGIVSIACVQSNRIEGRNRQDIVEYTYLTRELTTLPIASNRALDNVDYLENVLLVKGWRRYTWQDMLNTKPIDTLLQYNVPVITGIVRHFDKPLKKPVEISVLSRVPYVNLVSTDKTGNFTLNYKDLIHAEGEKLSLSVNEKQKEGYTIKVNDPFVKINNTLAEHAILKENNIALASQTTNDLEMTGFKHAILLQDVVIKGSKSTALYGSKPRGSNECDDFVNRAGYLNPPDWENQTGNTPPVKGRTYIDGKKWKRLSDGQIFDWGKAGPDAPFTVVHIVYEGCTTDKSNFTKIDGIYSDKEYYDNAKTDPGAAQYLSTLFWKAGESIKKENNTEYSFLAGDITGDFRIVVQGVGNNDVIYAEKSFNVK